MLHAALESSQLERGGGCVYSTHHCGHKSLLLVSVAGLETVVISKVKRNVYATNVTGRFKNENKGTAL